MKQNMSALTVPLQQRDVLRQALADAMHYRDPLMQCPRCPGPDNLCDRCATGLFSARAYLALSRTLGLATLNGFGYGRAAETGKHEGRRACMEAMHGTAYRSVDVDGLSVFYREAGPAEGPAILLLHGFPSSSRMWQPLFDRLADAFHLVAPDYPGFGHSDAPGHTEFGYTFDHLAAVVGRFTEVLGLGSYTLVVQDYGGPVGFRLAIAHPERLEALIVQNAVSHEAGLGPLWESRRAFWADRPGHEAELRESFFSLATTRQRHVGTSPNPENYDPDLWTDEFAFLSQPGQHDIQSDLFYDYRTNVASYGAWQDWLREHRPPLQVLWGRYDPSFQVEEAEAYRRDRPDAEIHVLDAGHFALDEQPELIANLIREFLPRQKGT